MAQTFRGVCITDIPGLQRARYLSHCLPTVRVRGGRGEIQNKNVKSYRLAVRAITKEELLTGVVTISVVECEHYKRWHKKTKKHQIRIVRTAQEGPEKRKGRAVLVKRYFCIIWNLPELVMV